VPTQRFLAVIALVSSPFLLGAACTKEGKSKIDTGAVEAIDRAGSGSDHAGATAPVDETPLPGITVDKLDKKKTAIFYRLMSTLTSPCGKAHSLRTSVTTDMTCKRAPFAARLVASMLEDEAAEADVKEQYRDKYQSKTAPKTFQLEEGSMGTPYAGTPDSGIVLVEFYDYACPACQAMKPELDKTIAEHGGDFVVYYKQFPLVSKHPDSHSAAQAALAAARQGKFKEMHDTLFERAPAHKRDDVIGYAKELGLDIAKFEADYDALAAQVDIDQKQGDDAGVDHTPTLFFNGVEYKGPHMAKYMGMWIEEEVAVNR
jgi:protein-disulfide isomerase